MALRGNPSALCMEPFAHPPDRLKHYRLGGVKDQGP
jgi:hypothetical protein